MTTSALRVHEHFLETLSEDEVLEDDRFVARNFRLDEVVSDVRANAYARQVFPAEGFLDWQRKHAQYLEDHIVRTAGPDGPPAALDPSDTKTCPETFGPDTLPAHPVDLGLSLVRVVGLFAVAEALGIEEASVRSGLEDPGLRDGIIDRWSLKIPVAPVFATLWQDVKALVPKVGEPPAEWADDLRDRLGLSQYDPDKWGPIQVMVLRYSVVDVPTTDSALSRPLVVPTELDGPFFPPFCPAPAGTGIGRVVDLGQTLTRPWPELLHPTFRWRGEHVAQLGVIERPLPSVGAARGRHLKLLQAVSERDDYGVATDGDMM